ncbi:MAG TPA: hypothetical protein VEO56_00215 [Bacteroidota bacterium]|nr:hypothetical protein [Bacteroidota bacterium]
MEKLFSPEELDLLADLVREYLGELRTEIRDTDSFAYKELLRHKETALQAILTRLEDVLLMPA